MMPTQFTDNQCTAYPQDLLGSAQVITPLCSFTLVFSPWEGQATPESGRSGCQV